MQSLIKTIKRRIIAPTIYNLSLQQIFSYSAPRKLILCYHGVSPIGSLPFNGRHLPSEIFEKHLRYFRRHADIVTLEEIFRMSSEKANPKRLTLALTFDDGYLNNLECALPLLEKYRVPASFFVSSIALENPDYVIWADILDILRIEMGQKGIQIGDLDFRPFGLWDMKEQNSGKILSEWVKLMPYGVRDIWLGQLMQKYHFYDIANLRKLDFFRLMNRKNVHQLSKSPYVEIGSHGHLHYNLAHLTTEKASIELDYSKRALEKTIDKEVRSIAYPDGNYDEVTKSLSREIGYQQILALNYQTISDKEDDDILPRSNVSGTTTYHSQILYMHQQQYSLGF